jgi:hypothetical protein
MTMKLFYYEDVTPCDYEPPGFEATDDNFFTFNTEPLNIKVGDISTVSGDHGNKKLIVVQM